MSKYKLQGFNNNSEALVPLSNEGYPEVEARGLFEAFGNLMNFDCGDWFNGDKRLLTVLKVSDMENGIDEAEALLVEDYCGDEITVRNLIFESDICPDSLDYFVEQVITNHMNG